MNTVRTAAGENTGAQKVALVTGAGSGIGRAVAVELLA
ncbi:3-oxoacyl-ACP reductase, partial [Streptomyces rochei]|nr:3-oxoacyl-ACP reductase [Streptomyces rochei]